MAENLGDLIRQEHTRREQMKPKSTPIKIKKVPKKPCTVISNKFYRISPKNKKPYKAGMFVANMRNDGLVMIGFSFCNHHAGDRYDYVKGIRKKGLGYRAALERSVRWNKDTGYIVGPPAERDSIWIKMGTVFIPLFAAAYLYEFLLRCDRYYKFLGDKLIYPEWISRFKSECTYIKKEKKKNG